MKLINSLHSIVESDRCCGKRGEKGRMRELGMLGLEVSYGIKDGTVKLALKQRLERYMRLA